MKKRHSYKIAALFSFAFLKKKDNKIDSYSPNYIDPK